MVYGHFGPTEVRTQDTSAYRHFGTGAEVFVLRTLRHQTVWVLTSKANHIADYAKAYPWIAENNFKFNSRCLYRAALSLGGELQLLVFMISGCSAPCSTASGWAEIIRCAWLQTDYRPARERRPVIQEELSRDQTSTLTSTTIIIAFEVAAHRAMPPSVTCTTGINCDIDLISVSFVSKRERVSKSSFTECTRVVSSRQRALECDKHTKLRCNVY